MKIGVMTPTFNRPDLARLLVLQMENQTQSPDLLCVHQNGTSESYAWAVEDIDTRFPVHWMHNPGKLAQDDWYARPLEFLIEQGCSHFFWCDHDDIYRSNHIESTVGILNGALGTPYDFVVNAYASVLLLKKVYEYAPLRLFNAHAPGGMSSSMGFTRNFAIELLHDLKANLEQRRLHYSDQVLALVTMPKFACFKNVDQKPTTTYVAHSATVSSASWVSERDAILKPLVVAPEAVVLDGIKLLAHLAHVGDVTSETFYSLRGASKPVCAIQGFTLVDETDHWSGRLEYRARLQSGEWTAWVSCNQYAGTRGRSQDLSGFSLRVSPDVHALYDITLIGLFDADSAPRAVKVGSDCLPQEEKGKLMGMQILFHGKPT